MMSQRTAIIIVLVVVFCAIRGLAHAAEQKATKPSPSAPDAGPGRAVPTLGNQHVASPSTPHVPYNTAPPTSGPHLSWVAKWGVHRSPIIRELQVHNLEDGGVLVQYQCKAPCPELVAKLEALAARYQAKANTERAKISPLLKRDEPVRSRYDHLIVAPYPDMEPTIALTAWGRIDTFNEYDDARIERFIEAYIGIDHHPTEEKAPAPATR
jgi:hypothetical protein